MASPAMKFNFESKPSGKTPPAASTIKNDKRTAFLLEVVDHKIGETGREFWVCGFFYCWLWRRFEWWNIFLSLFFSLLRKGSVSGLPPPLTAPFNHTKWLKWKRFLSARLFVCSLKDEGKDLVHYEPPQSFIVHPARVSFSQRFVHTSDEKD